MTADHRIRFACLLLLLLLLQGFYASYLNGLYYTHHGPFFDSMAYTERVAQYHQMRLEKGFLQTFLALRDNNTVVLPYLEVALLAPMIPLSRSTGVLLQSFWLAILLFSLYHYLTKHRCLPAWFAFSITIPLASFYGIYQYNGGLSDLRMDLSQYIFYALTVLWFLFTYETPSLAPWCLAGLFAALGSLSRATLPVHLVLALGPLIVIRMITGPDRPRLIKGVLAMAAITAAGAGPFFYLNYDYLHYYYVVWNADANANRPLRQSLGHLLLLRQQIGYGNLLALFTCGLAWTAAILPNDLGAWRRFDYRLVWIGAVPVGFLILRGAGDNPFVNMPSVFGVILFALIPFRGSLSAVPGIAMTCVASIAMFASCWNAASGLREHRKGEMGARMDSLRQVIHLMQSDATSRGLRQVSYSCAFAGRLSSSAMQNVMIYDFGGRLVDNRIVRLGSIDFNTQQARFYELAVRQEWDSLVAGGTDEEKLRTLIARAPEVLDYMVIPTRGSAATLSENANVLANQMAPRLREGLLASGRWEPVSPPLEFQTGESALLYRKKRFTR